MVKKVAFEGKVKPKKRAKEYNFVVTANDSPTEGALVETLEQALEMAKEWFKESDEIKEVYIYSITKQKTVKQVFEVS